ncbi:Vsp/OspC family lipoprotein (plasmid) [Borrelia puertoricensis]|uniref:Vsp/OspC family lipoprotein n=1 Tax=Borrelia puertoricensis TaxID=2756107 RepID=UPI003EBE6DA3
MKRITLCALFLTLFLLISCNNSGNATKDGKAARSDGTVIDLVTITNNIKDSVAFAKSVKDVHTLVKSVDELAKAIGKKVGAAGLGDIADHNGSLLAGVYSVILAVDTKLASLEKQDRLSSDLKAKVGSAKKESTAFLTTVKGATNEFDKEGAKDDDVKKAILKDNGDKTKGREDLDKLNIAIDNLLKDAEAAVTSAINALATPAKSDSPAQSN